jgi:hypothetical protein
MPTHELEAVAGELESDGVADGSPLTSKDSSRMDANGVKPSVRSGRRTDTKESPTWLPP